MPDRSREWYSWLLLAWCGLSHEARRQRALTCAIKSVLVESKPIAMPFARAADESLHDCSHSRQRVQSAAVASQTLPLPLGCSKPIARQPFLLPAKNQLNRQPTPLIGVNSKLNSAYHTPLQPLRLRRSRPQKQCRRLFLHTPWQLLLLQLRKRLCKQP